MTPRSGDAGARSDGRGTRHILLAGVAGVALSLLSCPVRAQSQNRPAPAAPESTQGGSVELAPISVEGQGGETAKGAVPGYVATRSATATKTDTPLIETPQSIAVIGQDQIQSQKAQTLSEAVRYSPGILGEQFGANNRLDFYLIRGFKADDTGLYKDGLQLFSTGFANFRAEPFGLDRIEILRGPSSDLFGGSSPGGLVNLVTKRPTSDPLHYVEVGGGSFGQNYGQFDLSGPVTPNGDVLYRFTGVGRQGGTQVDFGRDDRLYLAPALTFKPDDTTTFTILTSYQQDHSNTIGEFLPYYGTVRPTNFGNFAFGRIPSNLFLSDKNLDGFNRRQAFLGYEFEHKFDDVWTVRQNFRFSYLDVQDVRAYGGGYADAAQTMLQRFPFRADSRVGLTTVDNQAEARFLTGPLAHTFLFGLDYKNYDLVQSQAFNFGPAIDFTALNFRQQIPFFGPYLANRQTVDQIGLYAQDQIKFDRFVLTLTGRQDFVSTHTYDRLANSGTDQSDSAFSGRVGLLYESEIGLSPYASYSKSFSPLPGTDVSGRAFNPETGEQVEVGAKYQPPGWSSFVAASAFDLRRQNVQVPDPANPFNQLQTGEIRSTGVELQAVSNPFPGLNLVGAYTIYDLANTKTTVTSQIGKVPVATPQNFASLFADYTIQDGPLRGFGFGGGVRYVGRSFADADNAFKVPDHTLLDGVLHYDLNGWRLAVNAQNLLDRTFVSTCSGTTSCFYGDRRKVTGSLSYRW